METMVMEEPFRRRRIEPRCCEELTQHVGCLGPKRTEAFLASFALKPHLAGALQLQVTGPKVEQFLNTCSGVEKGQEQRVITPTIRCPSIGGIEHGPDSAASRYSTTRVRASLNGIATRR